MSSKGKYFLKTLTIISQQKVTKKKVIMTFHYRLATKLLDKNDEFVGVKVPYPLQQSCLKGMMNIVSSKFGNVAIAQKISLRIVAAMRVL